MWNIFSLWYFWFAALLISFIGLLIIKKKKIEKQAAEKAAVYEFSLLLNILLGTRFWWLSLSMLILWKTLVKIDAAVQHCRQLLSLMVNL